MKSDHEGVQYNCELCDYKAAHKANLKRHVNSVHERDKYSCDLDL